jgi:tRNA modification GTPase
VDTAGLRETADRVEGIGIEVARRYLDAADGALLRRGRAAAGRGRARFLAGREAQRTVLVRTKADLHVGGEAGAPAEIASVSVAAHAGEGIEELRQVLLRIAFGGLLGESAESPLITRERHARALRAAEAELQAFVAGVDASVPMEFAATHLRAAIGFLEDMVGAVTPDDVLDRVFRQFCVGK